MVEHDELMRQAVAALRASRSPTPGAQGRVLAALELQLGGPPGGFDPGDGSAGGGGAGGGSAAAATSSAPASIGWVAKVVGATASMTSGGLLLVWAGASALQSNSPEREPVRDDVVITDTAEPSDIRRFEDEAGRPVEEHEPPITVYPGERAKPRAVEPTEPLAAEPTDTLAAELALLNASKRASEPSAALVLLDQHAREYPDGTMASEREALAVVALCQLERTEEARARARVLIARRPSLPLLHRMRSECPALTNLLRQVAP